jgi:lipopolysaccharide transport system ATP-binding protein
MSEAAIQLRGVGKMYKTYPSHVHRAFDAMGFSRLVPFYRPRYAEFWALRGIDLELAPGQRVGVVGRNGAGKTTLLRLLTGNLPPTEGIVDVRGPVQALFDTGGGFHPEFTGRENVRVSLTYQGLRRAEIEEALVDIAEFTELEGFLDQPYGTYSAGMQARLAFAAATSVRVPSILIIDEMLGAGDAYFLGKCTERMQRLVESGATILLVSHALEQVTRFCDDAVWIERGRIVEQGPALEVVKAYQQFVRVLEERRFRERNRGLHATEPTGDVLRLKLSVRGAGAACDVREVSFGPAGGPEERLGVGEAQDVLSVHHSFVILDGSSWSAPSHIDGGMARTLAVAPESEGAITVGEATGTVVFAVGGADGAAEHAIEVVYRAGEGAEVWAEAERQGAILGRWHLPALGTGWVRRHLPLGLLSGDEPGSAQAAPGRSGERRWPGEGSLEIERVRFLDASGREQALFAPGAHMKLEVGFVARRAGAFDLIPTAVVYRRDGLLVARYIGGSATVPLADGDRGRATLDIERLPFGNGYYVVSVALYRHLDVHNLDPPVVYDLMDRSYEFAVSGVAPLLDGVVVGEGRWSVD